MTGPRELPVAVFDSGVGGLTVLHECLVSLPHEDFLYLGDTARFPYGERPAGQLREFAVELAELLLDQGAKLVVLACNSATAAALPHVRRVVGGRAAVIGVVEPESGLAAGVTRNGRVGVLATTATVRSGAYERALQRARPGVEVHAVACPDLAPLIQRGGEVDHALVAAVERYCAPLRTAGVDTVVLGCTHYPLLRPLIRRALGRGVQVVTAGQAIADRVEAELALSGLANDAARRGSYRFLCSGQPHEFRRLGVRFLQMPLGDVERVHVAGVRAPSGVAA